MSISSTHVYLPIAVISFIRVYSTLQSGTAKLQAQIEREYKIRDGAARLLQASKSSRQSMEASKSLFVSNAKIVSLMKELQQRQSVVAEATSRYAVNESTIAGFSLEQNRQDGWARFRPHQTF